MSDLINRQDAIEYFMTNTNWHDEEGYQIEDAKDKRALLTDYFNGIPPAQKKGEWIKDELGTTVCSICKKPRRDNRVDHIYYCNSCGADMRSRCEVNAK